MEYILPTEHEANAVLGMLYGDSLDVKQGDDLPESDAKYVGLFVDPEDKPVAACICDTPFAAYAGSALTMLPPGGAEDAAETGELSQMMEENLYEVMNICSRMFMSDATPHLKLELVHKYEDLPTEAKEVLLGAEGKRGLDIEVPRYGQGRLFMVTT
ncbi:MAG: hypothetical protein ACWA5X_07085 [bacterium]